MGGPKCFDVVVGVHTKRLAEDVFEEPWCTTPTVLVRNAVRTPYVVQ